MLLPWISLFFAAIPGKLQEWSHLVIKISEPYDNDLAFLESPEATFVEIT